MKSFTTADEMCVDRVHLACGLFVELVFIVCFLSTDCSFAYVMLMEVFPAQCSEPDDQAHFHSCK